MGCAMKILSLDTETTGVDFYHGALPYLVTMGDTEGNVDYWEWPVDPVTRKPIVPPEDLVEIQEAIDSADELVLQNTKFDYRALSVLFDSEGMELRWDWTKVRDTLLAAHLLASNQPKDLTTLALIYLNVNIEPYEIEAEKATNEARRIARRDFPEWRLAKRGLPEMPSAKEKVWKFDMWLPRALAHALGYPQGTRPTVVNLRKEPCDVRIDRSTKWGNPYVIGKYHGSRAEVIEKYRRYILNQPELLEALPELDGKRIGCFCKPEDCHGDVLADLVEERVGHPWYKVTAEYANADAAITSPIWLIQKEQIKQRGLTRIYEERLKILPIVAAMEGKDRGITVSRERFERRAREYAEKSAACEKECMLIARRRGFDLELPKSGNNKSLSTFVFSSNGLDLKPHKRSEKTGEPSLDKATIDHYISALEDSPRAKDGPAREFMKALRTKRKVDTALSYMEGYKRFWLPFKGLPDWFVLHPSLNPTGSNTLRWSSQNPNEQNISKQEEINLRYCFGPAPGREWWSCDANNIELRLPAYEAEEEEMIALFERPDDPPYFGSNHLLVSHILHPELFEECRNERGELDGRIFKKRYAATWYQWVKNGNFAVQYGAVEESGTADRAYHVKGAQRRIQERFKNIAALNQRCIDFARKHGYIETIPDKTVDPNRGYPLLCSRTKWGDILPTVPLNYHIQGTAMWWMMKAMIRVTEYLDELNSRPGSEGYYMVMQVHDELVFDFPRGTGPEPWKTNRPKIRKIQALMRQGGDDIGIPTPVGCEYHPDNWGEGISV